MWPHTHRTTTVTLAAHARRGLISMYISPLTVFRLLVSPRVAAGVTCRSPEKNHPWWSHSPGVHLGTRFLESVRLVRVPYGTVSDGDSSESFLTPLEISPRVPTRRKNTLSPSGMTSQAKRSARMTYSSLPYDGTLASLTLSRKRVPKCTPDGWLHQGWFFSGEQKVTPATTCRETSSRKIGEM